RVPGGAVEDSVPSGLAPQLGVDACGGGLVGPCGERVVGDAGFVGEPVKVGVDLGVGGEGGHAFSPGVTRSSMGTSRALAMRCMVMREGVRCPFSTRDREARALWVFWARSSRVHPRCSRRARMVSPLTVTVFMPAMLPAVAYRCQHCAGMKLARSLILMMQMWRGALWWVPCLPRQARGRVLPTVASPRDEIPMHASERWQRLAELLAARRARLNPEWADRTRFCSDTGLSYRSLSDLEN